MLKGVDVKMLTDKEKTTSIHKTEVLRLNCKLAKKGDKFTMNFNKNIYPNLYHNPKTVELSTKFVPTSNSTHGYDSYTYR